jgi:DNA primase
MPKLASAVPTWVESVTIVADNDQTGRLNAKRMHDSLKDLGFEIRITQLTGPSS